MTQYIIKELFITSFVVTYCFITSFFIANFFIRGSFYFFGFGGYGAPRNLISFFTKWG